MGVMLLSGLVAGAHAANPSAKVFTVGQFYEGGVIYWTDPVQKNQHGLIADINDISNRIEWSTLQNLINADGNGAYAGKANTAIIVAAGTSTTYPAGFACAGSNAQGYHDWYLPSEMELAMMFVNQMAITRTAQANGGSAFADINTGNQTVYWSSTESGTTFAWDFSFSNGNQPGHDKNVNTSSVRCVRAF